MDDNNAGGERRGRTQSPLQRSGFTNAILLCLKVQIGVQVFHVPLLPLSTGLSGRNGLWYSYDLLYHSSGCLVYNLGQTSPHLSLPSSTVFSMLLILSYVQPGLPDGA